MIITSIPNVACTTTQLCRVIRARIYKHVWACPSRSTSTAHGKYTVLFTKHNVQKRCDDGCSCAFVACLNKGCQFLFFSHTSTFQLLDKPWPQVSSILPPGSCLQFLSRIGFSNPTARRFSIECCQLTLSRFPQVNLCTRKSPNEFIRVCTRRGSKSRN